MGYKVRQRELKTGGYALYVEMYANGVKKYKLLKGMRLRPGMSAAERKRILGEAEEKARAIYKLFDLSGPIDYIARGKIDFLAYFKSLADERDGSWQSVYHHLKEFQKMGVDENGELKLRKLPIAQVDDVWLHAFRAYLVGTLVKGTGGGGDHYSGGVVQQSTACTYFQKVSKALRLALKEKVIQVNPMVSVDPIPMPKDFETRYLSDEEIDRLLSTPWPSEDAAWNTAVRKSRDVRRAYLFAVWTSLRYSDLKAMKYSDISRERYFDSRDQKEKVRFVLRYRMKKTGKFNTLVLSEMALRIIDIDPNEEFDGKGELVFDLYESKHINVVLRQWMKKAKIKWSDDLKFHSSRHTHAVMALTHQVPIYTVSKNMGHSTIKTTERYAAITSSLQTEAAEKLPVRDWKG